MKTIAARRSPATPSLPPGPGVLGTLDQVRRMQNNILGVMEHMASTYGPVSYLRAAPNGIVLLSGAEAAKHVLVTHQDRYPKSHQFDLFRPLLGDGLVTSAGDVWRTSRRLTQPMFAKRHLSTFADSMAGAARDAVERWEADWPDDHVVDLDTRILEVGLDTVGRALASHDFSDDTAGRFAAVGAGALHEIGMMSKSPAVFVGQDVRGLDIRGIAKATTPRSWRRYEAHCREAEAIIAGLVDDRYENGHGDRNDLLKLLTDTIDDDGTRLSRQQVMDEVKTFIAAGHETTAHGLAWMFYLLAQHPDAYRRLHDEVDAVLDGRVPTADDADSLPWLTACFNEAMRLYPPVWHLPRLAADEDVIDGHRIPKGSRVLFSIWATHRDPEVYPEPEEFRPERWIGDAAASRDRFAYLPFGGGRRICIGQGFAMLNAVMLGATMASRFEFAVQDPTPINLVPSITIRPARPMTVRVKRRRR